MQHKVSTPLLSWYDEVKRDLPWRRTRNPYYIWLSEIMLQQTRVETVKDYYKRFLEQFPTISALAVAPEEQVLKSWEGLGYYSRARNLQKAAQVITNDHGGEFPSTYDQIIKLPGIGPYTAGAIGSIAFGLPVPAIDGNVYRVASRLFGIREDIGIPSVQREIRALVIGSLPSKRVGDYNQALMELGASHCSPHSPACDLCPLAQLCDAFEEGDMDLLPIHEKKRPPKVIDLSVCLLTYKHQVLVVKRSERLLHGLFVFFLIEDIAKLAHSSSILGEQGLDCKYHSTLGEGKHIFTHRIWNMTYLHFELQKKPSEALLNRLHAQLVSKHELEQLPLPTAMKAAKEKALALI